MTILFKKDLFKSPCCLKLNIHWRISMQDINNMHLTINVDQRFLTIRLGQESLFLGWTLLDIITWKWEKIEQEVRPRVKGKWIVFKSVLSWVTHKSHSTVRTIELWPDLDRKKSLIEVVKNGKWIPSRVTF